MKPLDRWVLGHNSFFGIDHLSAKRAVERSQQLGGPKEILERIEYARECGAGGMMMSTHPLAKELIPMIAKSRTLQDGFQFYPLLPYAQKYVVAANQRGLINAVLDVLAGSEGAEKLKMIGNMVTVAFTKDVEKILENLIIAELKIFKPVTVNAVFLHDVLTDMLLALGLSEIAKFYCRFIHDYFGYQPAFATKNPVVLLQKFLEWGIDDPVLMIHLNKKGFWVHPDLPRVEKAIRSNRCRIMAMSTLACGYLTPEEAFPYLASFPTVQSIVVGASSKAHIQETFHAARTYFA
jgi:hypothetical protein